MDDNEGDAEEICGRVQAKVALEAIWGDLTLAELAARHGIHPTMIATWKRQATEGMVATFSGASEASKTAGETRSRSCTRRSGSW